MGDHSHGFFYFFSSSPTSYSRRSLDPTSQVPFKKSLRSQWPMGDKRWGAEELTTI